MATNRILIWIQSATVSDVLQLIQDRPSLFGNRLSASHVSVEGSKWSAPAYWDHQFNPLGGVGSEISWQKRIREFISSNLGIGYCQTVQVFIRISNLRLLWSSAHRSLLPACLALAVSFLCSKYPAYFLLFPFNKGITLYENILLI